MRPTGTRALTGFLLVLVLFARCGATAETAEILSHPPMRPLPTAADRPIPEGPVCFVDPVHGNDRHDGTRQQPWKTIGHALGQLRPGDTLLLRGGTYYEPVLVRVSGTAEKPITIRAHPGELAILDGGYREFAEAPAAAWEPAPGGVEGDFRSTKTYHRGGGFGNFGDSMVPFHCYLNFHDLRSTNELFRPGLNNRQDDPTGMYAGPGVRRDPATGRIHIRLAHTRLAGLGESHYQGETNPRKLPLVISGEDCTLRIEGAGHLRVQDLVVRGGQRAAVRIADSEDLALDGCTLYGSQMALRVSHTRGLRVVHSALRGHAAPWHSRFHHKNRAGSGYLVLAEGDNFDFEFAHCELTDHHDCFLFRGVEGMRFHHNLVDNFNDDGLEPGPKAARGRTEIYQNRISRCLNPFTAHGKKPVPVENEPGSGVYVFRNVVDLRQGIYRSPPAEPDPTGAFLNSPTTLVAHDHGGPTHAVYYVYHNTFLLPGNAFRGYYAFTWGSHTRGTTRRVFNNIFVQTEGLPGLNFSAIVPEDDFQADGNLLWGVKQGPTVAGDYFETFRRSPLFEAGKTQYPPGWGAHDRFADPQFVSPVGSLEQPMDLRLRPGSPAVDAGVALPADWPDPLHDQDRGRPDLGALPLGAEPLETGPAR